MRLRYLQIADKNVSLMKNARFYGLGWGRIRLINKIHIIGSVGSGKSTLARKLSERLAIPYFELDNVVWQRTAHGDIRNPPEIRDKRLRQIVQSEAWIIEGVHYEWVEQGFRLADRIIYLDTPIYKRNYRVLKRYIIQKLGLEKGNYKQSLYMLKKMYHWIHTYEEMDKPEILARLEEYKDKLIILKDNTEVEKVING